MALYSSTATFDGERAVVLHRERGLRVVVFSGNMTRRRRKRASALSGNSPFKWRTSYTTKHRFDKK